MKEGGLSLQHVKGLVLFFIVLCASFDLEAGGPGLRGRHWEIGPEVYHAVYEEPGVMKQDGTMFGLKGAFVLHNMPLGPVNMLRAEAVYARGDQDYTSGLSGDIENIENTLFEVRGLLGHDIRFTKSVLTPYIGFGYRWNKDHAGGMIATSGALGYDRESSYLYSPLGILFMADLEKGWSIGGSIEYDLFWDGTQKSLLRELHPLNTDLENDQDEGYGLRASLKIAKELDSSLRIIVEPFVRYWDIGQSEPGFYDDYNAFLGRAVKKTGYEPDNNTTEYGVRVVLGF